MARMLAAERGIFSMEELHKQLLSHGITISSSQLGKVLRNQTRYCDLELLDALRKVLDTSFDRLLISRELKRHTPATVPQKTETKAELTATIIHDASQQNQALSPPAFTSLPRPK
jgi:hypothetical protein